MSEAGRNGSWSPPPPRPSSVIGEGIPGAPGPGSGYASHDVVVVRLSSPYPPASSIPLTRSSPDGDPRRDGSGPCVSPDDDDDDTGDEDDEDDPSRADRGLVLRCAKSLTPADMMDLYRGTGDATGHAVWKGALLFVEAFCMSRPPLSSLASDADGEAARSALDARLEGLMQMLFAGKRVVELGCGTGVSGLALLKRPPRRRRRRRRHVNEVSAGFCSDCAAAGAHSPCCTRRCHRDAVPSGVTFTDFDDGALELCRRNCEENLDQSSSSYALCQLRWGEGIASLSPPAVIGGDDDAPRPPPSCSARCSIPRDLTLEDDGISSGGDDADRDAAAAAGADRTRHDLLVPHSYDTALATDVLYDVASLRPLLRSASDLVREGGGDGVGGYFVMSHVPRATMPGEEENVEGGGFHSGPVVAGADELERFIVGAAADVGGFELADVIRPEHLAEAYGPRGAANGVPFGEMEGASILVFRR